MITLSNTEMKLLMAYVDEEREEFKRELAELRAEVDALRAQLAEPCVCCRERGADGCTDGCRCNSVPKEDHP